LAASDDTRLSVAIIDVHPGREREFLALAPRFKELLERKQFCVHAATIPDEGVPSRFYAVRQWTNAAAARNSYADREMNALRAELYDIALVTHVIIGTRTYGHEESGDDRRIPIERDRRAGFDRRVEDAGRAEGNLRTATDRRIGPRRERERSDLVSAARRARGNAHARFSSFKVGAALQAADGTIITGCNIENATYGLTVCAERVAMFKALSEGHRAFTRLALVVDMPDPTPPCGACRQILWEFGGNLEIRLANLTEEKGTHQLADLLPLPFDARLL
jgi:cytidine deaminase